MARRGDDRLWTLVLEVVLVGCAVVLTWNGLVTKPHRYDDLQAHGVPVRLQVTRCGVGAGGDSRGYGCRVRLVYGGYTSEWKEGHLRPMLSPDRTVGGVVDPVHPSIHATAYELATRAGAGPRGADVAMALFCALLAVVVGGVGVARRRRVGGATTRPER